MTTTPTPGYDAAIEAGAQVRARILASPEVVDAMGMAALLKATREQVTSMHKSGSLMALTNPPSKIAHYPVWQAEPTVKPALFQVLNALRSMEPWTQYLFLTQGHPALDGMSPLNGLRAGNIAHVLKVAHQYAAEMA